MKGKKNGADTEAIEQLYACNYWRARPLKFPVVLFSTIQKENPHKVWLPWKQIPAPCLALQICLKHFCFSLNLYHTKHSENGQPYFWGTEGLTNSRKIPNHKRDWYHWKEDAASKSRSCNVPNGQWFIVSLCDKRCAASQSRHIWIWWSCNQRISVFIRQAAVWRYVHLETVVLTKTMCVAVWATESISISSESPTELLFEIIFWAVSCLLEQSNLFHLEFNLPNGIFPRNVNIQSAMKLQKLQEGCSTDEKWCLINCCLIEWELVLLICRKKRFFPKTLWKTFGRGDKPSRQNTTEHADFACCKTENTFFAPRKRRKKKFVTKMGPWPYLWAPLRGHILQSRQTFSWHQQ